MEFSTKRYTKGEAEKERCARPGGTKANILRRPPAALDATASEDVLRDCSRCLYKYIVEVPVNRQKNKNSFEYRITHQRKPARCR